MKIDRETGPPIIIGRRIPIGTIIGGIGGAFALAFPAKAPIIAVLTPVVVGMVQVAVVNLLGVTK